MLFNEDSRVKIPALIHFTRLRYSYLSLKRANWDESTNIFPDLFREAMTRMNDGPNPDEIERTLRDASLLLDNSTDRTSYCAPNLTTTPSTPAYTTA